MRFKAVIFDLDGTLLDTLEDIAISVNYTIAQFGKEPIAVKEYRYLVGEGAFSLMQKVLPGLDDEEIKKALDIFEKHYQKQYSKNTKLYEGIDKLLTFLQVKGLKLSILSNKPDSFTKLCAYKYLKRWKFDVVFGIREGVPKKPDPKGVFDIFDALDVKAEESLYFGDTSIDMITAKKAGIENSIGVLWGFRDKKELIESGAKYTVKSPEEFIKISKDIL